jgi:hypothetical protein
MVRPRDRLLALSSNSAAQPQAGNKALYAMLSRAFSLFLTLLPCLFDRRQRDDMGFPIEAENTLLYMGMEARLKYQADSAFEEWSAGPAVLLFIRTCRWRFLRESSLEPEIRKRSTRFRDLIRRGIPDTQRGEVWTLHWFSLHGHIPFSLCLISSRSFSSFSPVYLLLTPAQLWWKLPDVAAKMRASPQTYADYLSQRDKSTAWRVRSEAHVPPSFLMRAARLLYG